MSARKRDSEAAAPQASDPGPSDPQPGKRRRKEAEEPARPVFQLMTTAIDYNGDRTRFVVAWVPLLARACSLIPDHFQIIIKHFAPPDVDPDARRSHSTRLWNGAQEAPTAASFRREVELIDRLIVKERLISTEVVGERFPTDDNELARHGLDATQPHVIIDIC